MLYPIQISQGLRFFVCCIHIDMEILGTKRFIAKRVELVTTLSWPNESTYFFPHSENQEHDKIMVNSSLLKSK